MPQYDQDQITSSSLVRRAAWQMVMTIDALERRSSRETTLFIPSQKTFALEWPL
jgi:hypothetical protein